MTLVRLLISVAALAAFAALLKIVFERLTGRVLRFRYAMLGVLAVIIALFLVVQLNRPGDRDRIDATIEAVSTSADPAACRADETARFLEQSTGQPLPFAYAACESRANAGRADSVEISEVSVEGDVATALVTNSGGSFDGSTLRVRLAKDGRHWKVDELTGFADFDRSGFRRAYRHSFLEFGSSPEAVACAARRESRLSDAKLRREILARGQMRFARIAAGCDRAGIERSLAAEAAYSGFRLPSPAVQCVQARIRSAGVGVLARLQLDLDAFGRVVVSCDSDAYVSYLRRELSETEHLDPSASRCALAHIRRLPVNKVIRLSYEDEGLAELAASCGG